MRKQDLGRYAFLSAVALVILSGCGGSQSQMTPASAPEVRGPAHHSATPACSGSRIGRAQCDVLVENTGAHATYSGWTASDLEAAYNLPISSDGSGQNVFIVDAYDNPDVVSNFNTYRSDMGLPASTLNKYNQSGQQSNYPSGSPGWGVEIDLDVEMASASCPKCTINLVEANSNAWSNIEAAEQEAVKLGGTIVSNSYSGSGATSRPTILPASSTSPAPVTTALACMTRNVHSVVAVGGTELQTSSGSRGYTETLWPDSGGGCSSTGESKPKWEKKSKYARSCSYRMGNDVSAVAVDAAEYDTYSEGGWITVDGTSISSPFCAGIFGLAGNSTSQDGGRTFWKPKSHRNDLYEVSGRYTSQGGWGSPDGIGAF